MGRPKSEDIFHVFKFGDRKNWYMWYYQGDRRVKEATKYSRALYTRDQVLRFINVDVNKEREKIIPGYLTVGILRDQMLDRIEQEGKRKGTVSNYRNALDHLVAEFGSDFPVRDVSRSAVWRIQKYLIDKGDRPATANKIIRHLRGVFSRLVDDDILEKNPFRKFKALAEPNDKKRYIDIDDLKRLLAIARSSGNEGGWRLLNIAAFTGCRRREILEIKRDEIDIENRRVRVMNIKHSEYRKRWLPFPEPVVFENPDYRPGDDSEKEMTIDLAEHFCWFLEKSRALLPLNICHPDTFGDWTKRWILQAGLSPDLHLHSLRHSFVTLAIQAGTPIREIQKFVDHSDLSVTEEYAHDITTHYKAPKIGF